tara:strand:+ start:349 stop:1431 length:1083 start_codon:yes stop_codon:yes gene_type:complete
MIPVTKPYLPSREKLNQYLDGIYEREWLTNNGPLLQELTQRLEAYLGVQNLLLVSNGTLALQIAYRALGISGQQTNAEAITTPFTFAATASSLKWEGVTPIFTDIDAQSWCLDPARIEAAITDNTRAIVPVHVFGNACEVEQIDALAKRHNLKVVYDAAHAFNVTYRDKSLLSYGDASTLSFHATKLFHSVEGGAIIFKRKEDLERAKQMINFGITGADTIGEVGINAKMNEFQAAMGLSVLDEIEHNLAGRQAVWESYAQLLEGKTTFQQRQPHVSNNHAYFPVLLESEDEVKALIERLNEQQIYPRRYFYPSLDTQQVFGDQYCPISRYIAKSIVCLPLFSKADYKKVINYALISGEA